MSVFDAKNSSDKATFSLETILSALHHKAFVPLGELRALYEFMMGHELMFDEFRSARWNVIFEVNAQHPILNDIPRTMLRLDSDVAKWLEELKAEYGEAFELTRPAEPHCPQPSSWYGVRVQVSEKYL